VSNYEDHPDSVISFNRWWISYLRKQEDKTPLARSIAFDAWVASRDLAEDELY
jgi:hypothetical protein